MTGKFRDVTLRAVASAGALFALLVVAVACAAPPRSSAGAPADAALLSANPEPAALQPLPTVEPTLAELRRAAFATVQAAATAAAPTSQAAATRAVPTLRALSTSVAQATPVAALQQSQVVPPPLRIARVVAARTDPAVTVQNSGDTPVALNGWTLLVGDASVTIPPTATWTVPAHGAVTLHLSSGASRGPDIYLGQAPDALVANLVRGTSVALVDTKLQPVSVFRR